MKIGDQNRTPPRSMLIPRVPNINLPRHPPVKKGYLQSLSPRSNLTIESSQSQSSQVLSNQIMSNKDQELICLTWSPFGNKLCGGFSQQIKIWQVNPSQIKNLHNLRYSDFDVVSIRYMNENVVGALGDESVKFWDLRQNQKQVLSIQKQQDQYCWVLFDVNQKSNSFVLGSEVNIKKYDYRFNTKKGYNTAQYKTEVPIFDIKSLKYQNTIIAGGGIKNQGILTLFNENLQSLFQKDIHNTQIKSLSVNQQVTKLATLGQDNLLLIHELPQLICEIVIDINDNYTMRECALNSNGDYVSVVTNKQILIFDIRNFSFFQKRKLTISKYSPACWHPTKNLLAYISSQDQYNISLTVFD